MYSNIAPVLAKFIRNSLFSVRIAAVAAIGLVCASRAFAAAPVLTAMNPITTGVGFTGEYFAQATNNPTFAFTWVGTTMPGTNTFNTATGEFKLDASAQGDYELQITASNSDGSVSETVDVSVYAAPVFTSSTVLNIPTSTTVTFQTNADNSPLSFSVTGESSGFPGTASISSSGVLQLNVTSPGSYTVSIQAGNPGGTGTQTIRVNVGGAGAGIPVMTSPTQLTGVVGQNFYYQMAGNNSPTSYNLAWNGTPAPGNGSMDTSTGFCQLNPSASGTYTFIASGTNSYGTGYQNVNLQIYPQGTAGTAPELLSITSWTCALNETVSYQVVATGNPTSFTALWNGTACPGTVTGDPSTGYYTLTPSATGTYHFDITATNSYGTSSVQDVTVTVIDPVPPVLTSSTTYNLTVGTTSAMNIVATNGATMYGATWIGTACPGTVSFDTSTGALSFNPSATGTYHITVAATNTFGTDVQNVTLNVTN